jgi:hypothetical protein
VLKTFNLDEVLFMVGTLPITEYAEGDSITVAFSEDDWEVTQGHHGSVVRAKKPNAVIDVTVRTMQGSQINTALGSLAVAGRGDVGTPAPPFPLTIQDLRGTDLVSSGQAFFMKIADLNFSSAPGAREWTMKAANPTVNHGALNLG